MSKYNEIAFADLDVQHKQVSITTHVTIIDNRAAFIKRATGHESSARLAHEAWVIEHLKGLGVSELVAFDERGDKAELVAEFVGGATLADLHRRGSVTPALLATNAAALSETLAAAHERGIVHGRVGADHVLAPASLAPILCGWADAVVSSDSPTRGFKAAYPEPRDDVIALAHMLFEMLDGMSGDLVQRMQAVVERVLYASRGKSDHPSLSMGAMASCFRFMESAEEPCARKEEFVSPLIGRALYPKSVKSSYLRGGGFKQKSKRPWVEIRGRGLRLAGIVASLVVFAIAGVLWAAKGSSPQYSSIRNKTPIATDQLKSCDVVSSQIRFKADFDGDGCEEPFAISGTTIRVGSDEGGATWRLGQEGDLVVVGDWDGDELPTAGLIRPSTGEVWVFDSWASKGEVLASRLVPTLNIGAVQSARVISSEAGIGDVVVVESASGARHVIKP